MKSLSSLAWKWIVLVGVLILIAISYTGFNHYYVYTGDAFLQGKVVPVAAAIAGKVVAVEAHEGEYVTTGKTLFRIDPRPYRYA